MIQPMEGVASLLSDHQAGSGQRDEIKKNWYRKRLRFGLKTKCYKKKLWFGFNKFGIEQSLRISLDKYLYWKSPVYPVSKQIWYVKSLRIGIILILGFVTHWIQLMGGSPPFIWPPAVAKEMLSQDSVWLDLISLPCDQIWPNLSSCS